MARGHEARTLPREPVMTHFRPAVFWDNAGSCLSSGGRAGFDFDDLCFVGGALDGFARLSWRRLGFVGLPGGDDLSVAGLEPEPVLVGWRAGPGGRRYRRPSRRQGRALGRATRRPVPAPEAQRGGPGNSNAGTPFGPRSRRPYEVGGGGGGRAGVRRAGRRSAPRPGVAPRSRRTRPPPPGTSRGGADLHRIVGTEAVDSPGGVGTPAHYRDRAIVDEFCDRGRVIGAIEARAQAGAAE